MNGPTIRTSLRILATLIALTAASIASAQLSTESPRVRVTTNAGAFVIELNPVRAPLTVESFLAYVKSGFYTGTIFHRVVSGFVVQGGGYTVDFQPKPVDHTVVNESGNGLSNLRGTVGMARTGAPHSATSQFYVNLADNSALDPRPTRWGYAVFGKVIEGMDVVDQIGTRPTHGAGPFDRSVPVDPVIIEKIELISN